MGAGASGLMLAYRMANDSFFDDKSILIIDKDDDKGNDRTWCFWEFSGGEWDHLLEQSWSKIYFGSPWYSKTIEIEPYSYKMIRSALFYDVLWKTINTKTNICFINDSVDYVSETINGVEIKTQKDNYVGDKLFNSILLDDHYKEQTEYPVINQHFIGWIIETKKDVFDDEVATFMDFNVPQNGNTRFMYVLPLKKNIALVEYTLFSKDLLSEEAYENAIKDYLNEKNILEYKVFEKEKGSIPMTSYRFSKMNTKNILNIGTAGGWTKASTGYTFMNTTKRTKELVEYLKTSTDLSKFSHRTKFWWYDLLLLDVLSSDNGNGSRLFSSLFKKTKIQTIFKFLDEESSLKEDLKIITGVPPYKFVIAVAKRLFRF